MQTIIRPIISEKSLREAAFKKYTFEVNPQANKTEIKGAVERLFGVKVISVKTSIVPGKKYRMGKKRQWGQKSDRKKAIVAVKPDQKIELFESGSKLLWG